MLHLNGEKFFNSIGHEQLLGTLVLDCVSFECKNVLMDVVFCYLVLIGESEYKTQPL